MIFLQYQDLMAGSKHVPNKTFYAVSTTPLLSYLVTVLVYTVITNGVTRKEHPQRLRDIFTAVSNS